MRALAFLLILLLGLAPAAVASDVTTYAVQVVPAGSDGSAAYTATSSLMPGYLEDVFIDYAADMSPGTDVTVSYLSRGGTVLAVANYATDILLAPRVKPVDNASASITNAYDRFPLWDKVTVAFAQTTAATATVYFRVWRP